MKLRLILEVGDNGKLSVRKELLLSRSEAEAVSILYHSFPEASGILVSDREIKPITEG